ncbi:MAG: glycosyl hydrolase [Kiritimatiellae bacterium]|nr:glycosyl hydrolase [Kiritimatiellia bacterium]
MKKMLLAVGICLMAGWACAEAPRNLINIRKDADLSYKSKTVTMGQDFRVNEPVYVTAVGYLDEGADGLARERDVRVYRTGDGSLALNGIVAKSGGTVLNGFRYITLPQAVRLVPGEYVVATDFEEGSDRYISMIDVADFNLFDGALSNPKYGHYGFDGGFPAVRLPNKDGMAVHMTGANLMLTKTPPAKWVEALVPVDALDVTLPEPALGEAADVQSLPVTRAVLAALRELPSKKEKRLLSGQFMGWYPSASLAPANLLHQQTSNWVAVAGFDYYETFLNCTDTKPDLYKPPRWQNINELAKAYWEIGGLVTISCHMSNPWDGGKAWSKKGRFEDLLDKNTPAYARYMEQIDEVARGLADLQDAGVVVIFRPFHEMTSPFWWGGRDPETFKRVWQRLFVYYTRDKGLHNLIWAWSPLVSKKAMSYYPGNAYVDMTGLDIYADGVKGAKGVYAELIKTGKPFAITEFGPPGNAHDNTSSRNYDYGPFAKHIKKHMPETVFFLAWRDAWGLLANLNAGQLLNDPMIANKGELDFRSKVPGLKNFITRSGNKLMNGDKQFRFMGANMPGLVLPYDYTMRLPERMRLPTAWEIEDAFKTLDRMNLRVVRTWNLPMRGPKEKPEDWHYLWGPGQFNEQAFRNIDQVLATANRYNVRVMLDLTAGSGDYLGGCKTYAAHRGKRRPEFYTDPQLREDYKTTLRYVLNRVNTITGVPYKEDKAIIAWQFGNEMWDAKVEWLSEMAAYMKELDPNHLVAETRHRGGFVQIIDPNIDMLTRHFYSSYKYGGDDWAKACRDELEFIAGRRPLFVGEFGPYVDGKSFTSENAAGKLKVFLDDCIEMDGMAGTMLWSMYFHHNDGGYFWHQIYTFPSVWAYHYPGSPKGAAHAEMGIVDEMRNAAFKIQGMPVPPVKAPEAPELLPFKEIPMFTWRGSAGAVGYDIERAADPDGPWTVLAKDVSDAYLAYRPLFSDESAKAEDVWCYRVVAKNAGGASEPSNVIGPVKIKDVCMVDEFLDLSRAVEKSDKLSLDNTYNARFGERLFRVKGQADDYMAYRVNGVIREIRMTAFYQAAEGPVKDFVFKFSKDNKTFVDAAPQGRERIDYPPPPHADKKYRQTQIDYVVKPPAGMRFLRVEWAEPAALDRLEIYHSGR